MIKEIDIRRSIRAFQDRPVEEDKIKELLRAAMQAPSAGNQQPWEFIVVREKEKLLRLSKATPYSKCVADAPLAIILLANKERMRYPVEWQCDMGAAAENILLEAVYMMLGAVWIGIVPYADRMSYLKDMFGLKENILPFCIIAVGYSEEGEKNEWVDRYDPARIYYEDYSG